MMLVLIYKAKWTNVPHQHEENKSKERMSEICLKFDLFKHEKSKLLCFFVKLQSSLLVLMVQHGEYEAYHTLRSSCPGKFVDLVDIISKNSSSDNFILVRQDGHQDHVGSDDCSSSLIEPLPRLNVEGHEEGNEAEEHHVS